MENNDEKIILSLLYKLGQSVSYTKLQKLLFIIKKETDIKLDLKFVAYDYGPFARELYHIIEDTEKRGLVKVESLNVQDKSLRLITLTSAGKAEGEKAYSELDEKYRSSLDDIITRWGSEPLMSIVLYTYLTYPEMAKNSVIKDKLLN